MLVAAFDLQEMTIGNACVETDVTGFNHTTAVERNHWQLLVERLDQFVGFLSRYVSGRVVFDNIAIEADDVAAHGHLIPFDGHLHRGCFERTTTFEDLRDVVAQQP